MKTSIIVWIVVIIIVIIGGWYWWSQSAAVPAAMPESGTSATTTAAGSAYAPGNLLLGTDSSAALGTYLIGSNGMTLYTYAPDTAGVSTCTGTCAVAWPPYTIADQSALVNLQAGVTGTANSITRADGTMQVTYNGMPVYFYKGDAVSGDTNGQGIGGVWYVVKP